MRLTSTQRDIIVGSVLGDGFLQKTGSNNARLRFEHSAKQESYLLWKIDKLPDLFQGRVTHLDRVHPGSKETYSYVRSQSNATPILGKYRQMFYEDSRKQVPANLESLLSPLVLAVWYMDDGYYYKRDNCAYLYICQVKKVEAMRIQEALSRKLDLSTRLLDKGQKGWALYFSPTETVKLSQCISKYVIPEMLYKLPDPVTTERKPNVASSEIAK
ncbi:MAG: hypothetical protein AAB613_01365 [Patescibacteria group bacterium]